MPTEEIPLDKFYIFVKCACVNVIFMKYYIYSSDIILQKLNFTDESNFIDNCNTNL